MPLFRTINFNSSTKILVWEITETFEDLFGQVVLNDINRNRLNTMKSELHQRGFLSIRKLLQEAGYNDFDLFYDESGKPHLKDGKFISISHSFHFSAIIISEQKVGIDIEMQREKIIRIADKFVDEKELSRLKSFDNLDYIKKLTVKWGVKESIFKIRNEKGISFKDHIQVNIFEIEDKKTTAILEMENVKHKFLIHFEEIEEYILVYAFE